MNKPGRFTPTWLGLLMACLLIAGMSMLGGCADMRELTSNVSSYGSWPEGRKPGRYVFERLPSQQSHVDLQDKLEAAAQPVLAAAGFALVSDAKQADVSVQVASQVQVEARSRYNPMYGPYGPFGPWWRPGFGGWWGPGGRGGMSVGMSMEPPYVQMQVDVLIRDRRGNQVLYETHAAYDRVGAADERLFPYLFEAALKDFPHQAVSPRAVTVTVQPDNH